MVSPFPGMDPYIEQPRLWPDFHDDLIGEIKRALAPALPPRYVVRTGERSYVVLAEAEGKEGYPFLPDLGVTAAGPPAPGAEREDAATEATGGPVSMLAFVEERYRENFIEILDLESDERLVTCVEVLSPSNKKLRSKGRRLYLRKRQALLRGAANLVEVDLLRGGHRMPMAAPWPKSPYTILVCRKASAPHCTVWRATFEEPLPVVPVPLEAPDVDVPLDLQPMVAAIYARSRYGRSIDYDRPPRPPLTAVEERRHRAHLAAAGVASPASGRRRKRRP